MLELSKEAQVLCNLWHEQATELEDNPEDDFDNEKAETLRHCASKLQQLVNNSTKEL